MYQGCRNSRVCVLCPVRCISCDGSGQASAVTAALDWLAANVQLPAIASMSLGAGQPDSVLNSATNAILALGVTVVTAAGNYNDGKPRQPFLLEALYFAGGHCYPRLAGALP